MKHLILIATVALSSLFNCDKSVEIRNEDFKISVVTYRLPFEKRETYIIDMEKKFGRDTTSFNYNFLGRRSKNYQLVIYKDSICYDNTKLKLLSQRIVKVGEKKIFVDKYLCHDDYRSLYLFIEKTEGLLIEKNNLYNIIHEYHHNPEIESIYSKISNDSVFFEGAY